MTILLILGLIYLFVPRQTREKIGDAAITAGIRGVPKAVKGVKDVVSAIYNIIFGFMGVLYDILRPVWAKKWWIIGISLYVVFRVAASM